MVTTAIRKPGESTTATVDKSDAIGRSGTDSRWVGHLPAFPARRAGASAPTRTVVKAGATETSLFRRMTDGAWRIVLEFEPLLAGFLPLATLDIGRSQRLSSKDRAELKVYLGRR